MRHYKLNLRYKKMMPRPCRLAKTVSLSQTLPPKGLYCAIMQIVIYEDLNLTFSRSKFLAVSASVPSSPTASWHQQQIWPSTRPLKANTPTCKTFKKKILRLGLCRQGLISSGDIKRDQADFRKILTSSMTFLRRLNRLLKIRRSSRP